MMLLVGAAHDLYRRNSYWYRSITENQKSLILAISVSLNTTVHYVLQADRYPRRWHTHKVMDVRDMP